MVSGHNNVSDFLLHYPGGNLIEQSRFQNETLASVVAGFRQCTGLFCDAIDKSVEVSYTGVGLAQDANKLFDSISYNASSEHIEPFLDNMIQLTLDAHSRSQDVLEGFRAARRGLNEVSKHTFPHTQNTNLFATGDRSDGFQCERHTARHQIGPKFEASIQNCGFCCCWRRWCSPSRASIFLGWRPFIGSGQYISAVSRNYTPDCAWIGRSCSRQLGGALDAESRT